MFSNSLFRAVVNKAIYFMNTQNYDDTEIDKMIKFINFNKNIIEKKNNFFIHQINPHHPHRDQNCKLLSIDERYKINLKYYLNSTICASIIFQKLLKQLNLTIKIQQ